MERVVWTTVETISHVFVTVVYGGLTILHHLLVLLLLELLVLVLRHLEGNLEVLAQGRVRGMFLLEMNQFQVSIRVVHKLLD